MPLRVLAVALALLSCVPTTHRAHLRLEHQSVFYNCLYDTAPYDADKCREAARLACRSDGLEPGCYVHEEDDFTQWPSSLQHR